jgi:hypothetical protein
MKILKIVIWTVIFLLFVIGIYFKIRNTEFHYSDISDPWHTKIFDITANNTFILASLLTVVCFFIFKKKARRKNSH